MARLRLALGLVTALAVVHAQDAPQRPTFRTEANYVRVDMYPTLNGVPLTDLRQDEVEVLDNGVVQKIEQFERVQIRAAGPQETRVEPNTVRESRAMLEDSRARVFVLFLDTYHVEIAGSHNIRAPLVKLLDQVIGQDDLVGVMTPHMAASDIAFARKTTTIDGFLTRYWYWGDRDKLISSDPEKEEYKACYPGTGPTQTCPDDDRGVADEMLDRLREKRALDALDDLVVFLRGVREERKAVIAITDGWVLFGPNMQLARRLNCRLPSGPGIGIDPRTGKPTTKAPEGTVGDFAGCERDRVNLAQIDDRTTFQRMIEEANRANTSFYPVDPRGLVAFDQGLDRPTRSATIDQALLRGRADAVRTLADETDGMAVVGTNRIGPAMQRIAADLTSYYLLGYYTTAPLDGKFHSITVRVKRPGVQVRARRGYLAPSAADLTRAAAPAKPASPAEAAAAAEARAVETVIAPLGGYTREIPLRIQTVATPARVWVTGELSATELRGAWRGGGTIDLLLNTASGETVGSAHATVAAGARSFEASIVVPAPADYEVRIRARAAAEAPAINEVVKIAASAASRGARYVRRGMTTANRDIPAADLRFRRGETVRVEWPEAGECANAVARLLDRTGKPLPVPVIAGGREADAVRWRTAELAVAPLAAGDYILESSCGGERLMAGLRVIQ